MQVRWSLGSDYEPSLRSPATQAVACRSLAGAHSLAADAVTAMSHLSNVWFKVTDLQVVSGRGCRVTTVDGDEYLDFAAGIAVNSTGHSHPHVVDAIARQAGRFIHAQVNVFTHDLLEPLATRLAELAPGAI